MAIIGAIIGDIIGSQYEYDKPDNFNFKTCKLLTDMCCYTDDTVMSLAVKKSVQKQISFEFTMRQMGNMYPHVGYGAMFDKWLHSLNPRPYNSYGNGSAMRVSYIGEYYETLDEVKIQAEQSALISHNHLEGIKGAVITASCIWLVKHGCSKRQLFNYLRKEYPVQKYEYGIEYNLEYLRHNYKWSSSCQKSVPAAMRCFLESNSYENCMRNVLSLDCDADTLCAIVGGVAEEFYQETGLNTSSILERYLDQYLLDILYM